MKHTAYYSPYACRQRILLLKSTSITRFLMGNYRGHLKTLLTEIYYWNVSLNPAFPFFFPRSLPSYNKSLAASSCGAQILRGGRRTHAGRRRGPRCGPQNTGGGPGKCTEERGGESGKALGQRVSRLIPLHPVPSRSIPSCLVPSRPISSRPVQSHPIPSDPVPSHLVHPVPSGHPPLPSPSHRDLETKGTELIAAKCHRAAQGEYRPPPPPPHPTSTHLSSPTAVPALSREEKKGL